MEPKTDYIAKESVYWDLWQRTAMKKVVKALKDNATWDLVRPSTDQDVLSGKVKLGPNGQIEGYKASYVANGLKQVEELF